MECNGAINGNELSTSELLLYIIESNCDTSKISPFNRMKQLLDPTIKSSELPIDNSHDRKLMEETAKIFENSKLPQRYYSLKDSIAFSGICPFPEKIVSLHEDINYSSFQRLNSSLLIIYNIWCNILNVSNSVPLEADLNGSIIEREWIIFRKYMS